MTTLTERAKALTAFSTPDDTLTVIVAIAEQVDELVAERKPIAVTRMMAAPFQFEPQDDALSDGPETATHRHHDHGDSCKCKKVDGKWVQFAYLSQAWLESERQSDSDYILHSPQAEKAFISEVKTGLDEYAAGQGKLVRAAPVPAVEKSDEEWVKKRFYTDSANHITLFGLTYELYPSRYEVGAIVERVRKELLSRFGELRKEISKRTEMHETSRQLGLEIAHKRNQLSSDLSTAKSRVNELESMLLKLQDERNKFHDALNDTRTNLSTSQAKVRELEEDIKLTIQAGELVIAERNEAIAELSRLRTSAGETFWNNHAAWSQATFGSDAERGPIGPLKHLVKEAQEAIENPTDKSEYADCCMLVFDAARRSGMSFEELMQQCDAKLNINKARKWNLAPNGEPVHHVKETPSHQSPAESPIINPSADELISMASFGVEKPAASEGELEDYANQCRQCIEKMWKTLLVREQHFDGSPLEKQAAALLTGKPQPASQPVASDRVQQ